MYERVNVNLQITKITDHSSDFEFEDENTEYSKMGLDDYVVTKIPCGAPIVTKVRNLIKGKEYANEYECSVKFDANGTPWYYVEQLYTVTYYDGRQEQRTNRMRGALPTPLILDQHDRFVRFAKDSEIDQLSGTTGVLIPFPRLNAETDHGSYRI